MKISSQLLLISGVKTKMRKLVLAFTLIGESVVSNMILGK